MKLLKEIIPYIVIIIVVVLVRTYIITPVRVNGPSMNDTLSNGDILLLNKYDDEYKRFDIVVLNYGNEKIIKRIIGLPGDTIEYRSNILYVNGERVEEPFITEDTEDFSIGLIGYDRIPEDHYFVVGDNRNNSMDSRIVGPFNKHAIDGKVIFRIFPFKTIGRID